MPICIGGWRRTEPKRRHKSLDAFRRAHFIDGDHAGPKAWPCLRCFGRGSIPDPRDTAVLPAEATQYEIVCPDCNGTGNGPKAKVVKAYRKAVEEFKAEKREYEELVQARKEAIEILTSRQVQALKELGI